MESVDTRLTLENLSVLESCVTHMKVVGFVFYSLSSWTGSWHAVHALKPPSTLSTCSR